MRVVYMLETRAVRRVSQKVRRKCLRRERGASPTARLSAQKGWQAVRKWLIGRFGRGGSAALRAAYQGWSWRSHAGQISPGSIAIAPQKVGQRARARALQAPKAGSSDQMQVQMDSMRRE